MAPSFGRNRARRWAPLLAFALLAACGAPREPAAGGASKPAGGSTAAGSGTSAQPAASTNAQAGANGGTLVIAMTAANLPVTDQCPTEGAEGFRFAGYLMFDALTRWDLTHDDRLPPLVAGLAESWSVNPDDHSQWTFQLRKGVRFHDGTPFNADAVIFALDRVMKKDSPYYSERQAGCSASYVAPIRDYEKLDDYSVRINTQGAVLLPALLAYVDPDSQPDGGDGPGHREFPGRARGQRPVQVRAPAGAAEPGDGAQPRLLGRRAEARAADRAADPRAVEPPGRPALRRGQWAEVTPPESIKPLKDSGFQVLLNEYPQVWPWILNLSQKPWDDKRVRQAANYAINRDAMCRDLLSGACSAASQFMFKGHPWYSDDIGYKYDPTKARELLAAAGYPGGFKTVAVVAASGSGNMWPQPMNEYVQRNLREVGIDVELRPIEWNTMRNTYRAGFTDPAVGIYQYGWTTQDPAWIGRFVLSASKPARRASTRAATPARLSTT